MSNGLPEPFGELERFVADWSIADETDRFEKRHQSTLEEVTEFYQAVNGRLEEITTYLDEHSLDDLPEDCERLLHMAYMCMECFPAVELFRSVHIPQAFPWDQFDVVSPRKTNGR